MLPSVHAVFALRRGHRAINVSRKRGQPSHRLPGRAELPDEAAAAACKSLTDPYANTCTLCKSSGWGSVKRTECQTSAHLVRIPELSDEAGAIGIPIAGLHPCLWSLTGPNMNTRFSWSRHVTHYTKETPTCTPPCPAAVNITRHDVCSRLESSCSYDTH
jgi:hypothetical protein